MTPLRVIPSIEQIVQRERMRAAGERHGRDAIVRAVRLAADELRVELAAATGAADLPASPEAAAVWIESRAVAIAASLVRPSLRPVINATGVIVHTNLGRAPLADAAAARVAQTSGYTNLEYDLVRGQRGSRHQHAERLLLTLTGAEAAVVVNNNAAGALLALAALASGREVIVSRGELVEIGGGFRVPDILAQSGAVLREVGTTNRTRLADYGAAAGDRTAAILRVHPSNFRMLGFVERPGLAELAGLAHGLSLPLIEDLGSGWLTPETGLASLGEPAVTESLRVGTDLVLFSGDKLLGGPQCGIAVGRRALIERMRAHPLMRALRVGKLTYAALEATLTLWASAASRAAIPVYRMLALDAAAIGRRADAVAAALAARGVPARVIDGSSTPGGGSAPGVELATRLVVVAAPAGAAALERALRAGDPPVVARIVRDEVALDLRTVAPEEEAALIEAVATALKSVSV
jgi:L-seryl-tRNA(Ser) seleniumtransferase